MHYNVKLRSSRVTILLWKSHKYSILSGRVSVSLNLLPGMLIATYLLRVILSQFTCLPLPCLSTLCHKRQDYRKKKPSEHKIFIFSLFLYVIFLILRQIQQDIITNIHISM